MKTARAFWHAHPARPGPQHRFLLESQWWPRERLEALQADELRRLVVAATGIPLYRERFQAAGVGAADIATIADIRRFPILERSDVERAGVEGLRAPHSIGMRVATSGSLGRPVELLWPLSQMRWLDAGEARARGWLGWQIGERSLEVRCRPVHRPQAISAALLNAKALHAPSVADAETARRLVESLGGSAPTLVWGVSNALYVVALALLASGRTVGAKACWSGGNHLHPHYRLAMEEAFACPVYERYATMETGLLAHECPEGGELHVPAEGMVVEIVRPDGTPAEAGETGDVLVTVLHNRATPLIRYRIGDRAIVPSDSECSCGRGLPVFGRVAGRASDVLRTRSGSLLSAPEAVAAVQPLLGRVVDFQVIQDADDRLRILVVQRDSSSLEGDRERIAAIFEQLVEPPFPPLVERVDQIELTPGGKLRTLVSDTAST